MDFIITHLARLGAFASIIIFIWTLYFDLTNRRYSHYLLYKMLHMAIMAACAFALIICYHRGWQ